MIDHDLLEEKASRLIGRYALLSMDGFDYGIHQLRPFQHFAILDEIYPDMELHDWFHWLPELRMIATESEEPDDIWLSKRMMRLVWDSIYVAGQHGELLSGAYIRVQYEQALAEYRKQDFKLEHIKRAVDTGGKERRDSSAGLSGEDLLAIETRILIQKNTFPIIWNLI